MTRDAVPPAGQAEASKSDSKEENTAALSLLDRKGMKLLHKIVVGREAKYSRQADKLRAAQSATHVERAPKRTKPASATKPSA